MKSYIFETSFIFPNKPSFYMTKSQDKHLDEKSF